jgi:chemotaxis protein MotB
LLIVGCVSSGTHEKLQAEHDKTLAELKKAKGGLSAEEAKAKSLLEQIAKLEEELGTTRKDKTSLESSVTQMREALAELKKRKAEADARIAEFKSLVDKFKGLIDAGKLKVRIRDGRMVVELATDVLFPSGSAKLSADGQTAITEVGKLLATIPDRKFQIEGHTDNVPIKTKQYPSNWELAAARAMTVLNTMITAGMAPDRISAASFGENKPAKANDTPENKAANRRIEIVVVPDLSSLPGFEELQRLAT